jgi:hypothetical protein
MMAGRRTKEPDMILDLDVTEDNISTIFHKGDLLVGAEDLGTIRSARMTIHRNGTAFVYFDAPDLTGDFIADSNREVIGVPGTYQVMRAANHREQIELVDRARRAANASRMSEAREAH